ncbi:MAG TPA: C4-dicarboxylate transporter DcuC, partial [Gemmatales bacterium]|nr:C4-dicarboxylate transporter DcuC [Gemmatales bacterium]
LAALGQKPEVIIITFLQGMADATSIVPICSAMGFAYVIRAYGCDRELVKALTRPLLHAQYFLIPGTILVGFLVNITIISHTSTSLAVGTVLIPLLRNLGLRAVIIGSALVLGASIGGELLNPGAPELVAIANKLKIETNSLVPEIAKVVFLHLAIAILVYALLWRKDFYQLNTLNTSTGIEDTLVPTKQDAAQSFHEHESNIRWHLAIVPLVPIAILMLFGPPLNVFQFPSHWLLGVAEKSELYAPRLIGLSMLIGCLAACLAVPRQFATVATHFFDGAGYGYIHIISLIVVAKCFSEGIKLSGIAA